MKKSSRTQKQIDDEEFYRDFEKYMLSQFKRPGEIIETEMQLATRFGVTRYKIRKAIEKLNQIGILKRVKKKGSVVRTLDEDEFVKQIRFQFEAAGYNAAEFIDARVWLESALILILSERLLPVTLSNLEQMIDNMEALADKPLLADQWLKRFHLELFNASGNRIIKVYGSVLEAWFDATTQYVDQFPKSYFLNIAQNLREFMHALKKNEKLQAIEIMQKMIREKSQEIEQIHRSRG